MHHKHLQPEQHTVELSGIRLASDYASATCLGPLRYADKFILVGDHFQLPPLVRFLNIRSYLVDLSKRVYPNHFNRSEILTLEKED